MRLWDNVGKYGRDKQATDNTAHAHFMLDDQDYRHTHSEYTGCLGRNVPDIGRMFLKLKYTDIAQNTYIQSWTLTEIMAREVWKYDSCYTLIDY